MDELSDDFIVTTTDDGRVFQCSVAKVGADREQRWVLIDTERQLHIGPQLRKLVNEWWQTRKREERFDAFR
jgi:hypothetical protein